MEIVHPSSIDEALAGLGDGAIPLAGGTDVMVEVNFGHMRPESVVGLRRLEALKEWDGPRIGAGVTWRRIEREGPKALAEAARTVGSPQIRNAGTIGGNLGTASPAGDGHPFLAAVEASIELASGETVQTRLAVVADGAAAAVRGIARNRHDYRQTAIVAEIALDHPHLGIAYERFTAAGPVALLPEREHYALVWTQAPAAAARALTLPDAEFLASLAAHFGSRVRGFTGVRERRMFPLTLEVARDTTTARVAVIGNAAQALHPVAGQGFNLGLRDAFELATLVREAPRDAQGGAAMLARYRQARRLDRRAGAGA